MSHPAPSVTRSPITPLIRAQRRGDARSAAALRAIWRHHTTRVAGRFPAAWFPQLVKDDDALAELGDDLTARCAARPLARRPFVGRAPFVCFDEDDMEDRPILRLTFYGRYSLLRLRLADHHRANLRRHPGLAADARRFSEIVRALRAQAVPTPSGAIGERRWRPKSQALTLARDEDHARAALRALPAASVAELVEAALGVLTVATARQLHTLLLEARPLPEEAPLIAASDCSTQPELLLTVRRALMECWARLTPIERALLVWVAIGRSAEALTRLDPPRFPNRMAVHRAATRLTARLTAWMEGALGEGALKGSMGEVAELLVEALLELPALEPIVAMLDQRTEESGPSAEALWGALCEATRDGARHAE
ncbi:MAG: hypothetical protein IPI35_29720 [Deltaproteobacteria bacterium]|nr:hypothetical protein [Deltaproteobacteria bacterium]